LVKTIGNSLTSFFRDECFYLAGSIAYFLIVSLVPLSLLVIALFGYMLGGNQELYNFLLSKLIDFFPAVTAGITNELRNVITYKGISFISFIIYGFLSLQLFYSVEHAMDVIFKVPKKRHFLLSLLWTVLIVTLFIFFWLILLTFTTVYKIVPHVRVNIRHAFAGALLVTVLWELAKHLFTWFVKNIAYIGTIYGSLTTFILFLLWMYYLSCIFLLGGEFVNSLSKRS
jgi:membrane protein